VCPAREFGIILDDVKHASGADVARPQLGDEGATKPFLEWKFGDFMRLNPPAWRLLAPNSTMEDQLEGIKLRFFRNFTGTHMVQNVYPSANDIVLAQRTFAQYERDNIVKTRPTPDTPDEWIKCKQPLIIVAKNE
jgi:hypothetical protein